ncbi:phospholipid carrier-dependent glycosyltransferase [Chloroflexi bacterium TSY]|nr:phospholipid carrier-dependent glycosyltransferase [Chloroflexi bacterium TSY]
MWILVVGGMIWLPRGIALDRFVTADEHAWLTRSGNFYQAFAHGDYAQTFQRHHPGVTVTWAGLLGFVRTYPAYAEQAPGQFGWLTEEIEPFLESQGYRPIDLLAAGRQFVVLMITLALTTSFWFAVRLLGWQAALMGFGLIALAPFHVGLSRLLHLDGLLSSFMLQALLAFLAFTRHGAWWMLILSGTAAGLAWLTRSPGLFLIPFCGLVALSALGNVQWQRRQSQKPSGEDAIKHLTIKELLVAGLIWVLIGMGTFTVLWPAMWVAPLDSLSRVLDAASTYAAGGHSKPTFFNGTVFSGDPGWLFYPITFLWRTTPITLIGLLLAFVIGIRQGVQYDGMSGGAAGPSWGEGHHAVLKGWFTTQRISYSHQRFPIVNMYIFLLYALFFYLFMSLGAKKFDRYLLPVYPALDLVAAIGWIGFLQWLTNRFEFRWQQSMINGAVVVLIVIQASFSFATYPYYLNYYNPFMGRTTEATDVMMVGWGEGADRAAAQLTKEIGDERLVEQTVVASAYTNGPFSYFFSGTTLPIYFWHEADYAVLYAQDWQRRLPSPRQVAYFERLEPLHRITIDELEYAHIFDLSTVPLPEYVTEWRYPTIPPDDAAQNEGNQADSTSESLIRLVSYQLPSNVLQPGDVLPTTLYFVGLGAMEENLTVVIRLIGVDGREVVRSEGWPWGAPTSTWPLNETWPDGHQLLIPPVTTSGIYRLDVAFYSPATSSNLVAVQTATGMLLGEWLALDYVTIGSYSAEQIDPLEPPIELDEQIQLTGFSLQTQSNENQTNFNRGGPLSVEPRDTVDVALSWQALGPIAVDYTVFVHVVGSDGQLLTQHDQPPLAGFLPTTRWRQDQPIVDRVRLQVPETASPGDYKVFVGMYQLETGERLPIQRDGQGMGDAFLATEFAIK